MFALGKGSNKLHMSYVNAIRLIRLTEVTPVLENYSRSRALASQRVCCLADVCHPGPVGAAVPL